MNRFIKALLLFAFIVAVGALLQSVRQAHAPKRIGVVYLKGMIDASSASDLLALLKRAFSRPDVAGVVLRINSPGGSVAPSQEIYSYIMEHRKEKRIYASIGTVGASGAYYVASACNRVYADGGSIVGSIGVIFTTSEIRGLLDKIGVRPVVIKSGKFKDVGSPFREMSPEERSYIKSLLDEIHRQFVRDVAAGRGLKVEKVMKLADGRIFTGEQAVKLGLVDGVAPMWKVVESLSRDLGYSRPLETVVIEKKKGILDMLRAQAVAFVRDLKTELGQEDIR